MFKSISRSRLVRSLLWGVLLAALGCGALASPAHASPDAGGAGQWNITVVDNVGDVGGHPSIALKPIGYGNPGQPFVSYRDYTNGWLKYAYYNGANTGTCSSGWKCGYADQTGSAGEYSSLSFRWTGQAALVYSDPFLGDVKVKIIPANETNWAVPAPAVLRDLCALGDPCPAGEVPGQVKFVSGAWNSTGDVAVTYYEFTDNYIPFTGVSAAYASLGTNYNEEVVRESYSSVPSDLGYYASMGIANAGAGSRRVAYRGNGWNGLTAGTLNLAAFTGTADGHCEDNWSSDWHCYVVDPTPGAGSWISLRPSDQWAPDMIAYYSPATQQVKLAWWTGSGGDTCTPLGDPGWKCIALETVGSNSSMGVSLALVSGQPVIAYYDNDDYNDHGVLKLARWVGSNGNCGVGGQAGLWQCSIVDGGAVFGGVHDVGQFASMAVNDDGQVFIAYYDSTSGDLKVASEKSPVAPTVVKKYVPASIAAGGNTTVEYQIQNNYVWDGLSGISFLDTLSGQTPVQTLLNTCGGTVTLSNNAIQLTSGSLGPKGLASDYCSIDVLIKGTQQGQYVDPVTVHTHQVADATASGTLAVNAANALYSIYVPIVVR